MALKPISGGVDGVFRRNSYFPVPGETTSEIWVARNESHLTQQMFYYPRLDRFYAHSDGSDPNEVIWFDPEMVDNAAPAAGLVDAARTNVVFAVGEWDKVGNTQLIYGAINTGELILGELHSAGATPLLTLVDANPFPGVFLAQKFLNGPGNLDKDETPAADGSYGNIIIFETWGYAIQAGIAVRDAGATWYTDCLCLIDLSDGTCTPFSELGFRVGFDSNPNDFQNPAMFGDGFTLNQVQFVPDDDSQLAAPKGILAFSSDAQQIFPDGTGDGDRQRCYVRITEFNPEGLSATPGNPNRVHGRVTLFSRFHVKGDATPENGGMGGPPPQVGTFGTYGAPLYHPPTETWNLFGASGDAKPRDDVVQARFASVAVLDEVSSPTAESAVETGKTTTFAVSVSGDLGEPIPNQDIGWTLKRESTFEEVLDTSSVSGPPYDVTLTNIPLDGEIVEVRYNGTLLTDGVDYTIVLATGVITFIGAHAPPNTSGYTVTYSHRKTLVLPAHGTLLTSLSKSDTTGKAIARVQYPDDEDLETMVDNLDGTEVL